jgi:hypothetical protein
LATKVSQRKAMLIAPVFKCVRFSHTALHTTLLWR